jgi:hypothetical protein
LWSETVDETGRKERNPGPAHEDLGTRFRRRGLIILGGSGVRGAMA